MHHMAPCVTQGDLFQRIRKASDTNYSFTESEVMDTFLQVRAMIMRRQVLGRVQVCVMIMHTCSAVMMKSHQNTQAHAVTYDLRHVHVHVACSI